MTLAEKEAQLEGRRNALVVDWIVGALGEGPRGLLRAAAGGAGGALFAHGVTTGNHRGTEDTENGRRKEARWERRN